MAKPMKLRDFARAKREQQFRVDFQQKYGKTVEEAYPNVPFGMVYDLHQKEFKDPLGMPVYDLWAKSKLSGKGNDVSTETFVVSTQPAKKQDETDTDSGGI